VKCVILQPSYIPWCGYFHQIQKADLFVFYDDVQYDDRGFRNRNRVKTAGGPRWLTIPVHSQGVQITKTPIRDVRISWDRPWARKHWETIRQSYGRAPHFRRYAELLQDFYARRGETLADFTIELTVALAWELGLTSTRFLRSSSLSVEGTRTDRLLAVLAAVGGDHYISGPSARAYIEEDKLRAAGVTLEYMSYDYPEYEQLYPPFEPKLSILDLLFMKGPEAGEWVWGRLAKGAAP
jgi:WbqC-like protein family